ncbi:universal stress protein [Rhodoferax sp.]|uniref:universal stress protein n=1 Tax=Rhodoferax sp. TaxID=50421 RepID=UPI00284D3B32|nr:universal stress protein [Rhodoferax sp.]MDR3370491.1 universal stress protein [Rhodoferax sp.]
MSQLFTRLLLATEHTEFDTGAENLAISMAERCQLPLATVLPLVSNPEYESLAPQIAMRAELEAASNIANIRAQAAAQGVTIDLRVRRGEEPYREIVDEARERKSEVIIVRQRGKRGFLANLLIGETVSKVLTHAPCHVLFAPRDAHMWKQAVLVAAEPGEQGLRLVRTAAAVAAECGLPLHLVFVMAGETKPPDTDGFLATAIAAALQLGVKLQVDLRSGKAFTEILASATAHQADLLVIGSRSDNHIRHAMIGGVAQKVIGLSEKPVLVLNLS